MTVKFMEKYGGNVAGFFWNAGTSLQFFFGLAALSPREILSAAFNVASPCSYLLFGHKNWGVVLGGICGMIGTFLAVYQGVMNSEPAAIFGVAVFCGFVSLGIFSAPLTRRFERARSAFLRATLGCPRRLNGLGIFMLVRLPIIYESILHGRWHLAAVFAVWGFGDLAFSCSRPNMPKA